MSTRLKWGLKLSFTAGLIVAVATIVGWREIQHALLNVDMKLVGLAWLLGFTSRCGEAVQLSLIMRRAGLSIRAGQVLVASSLSTLYGLVLPGDLAASVAKWACLSRATGKRSGVINAIVYNRIIALIPWVVGGTLALSMYNPWNDVTIPLAIAVTAVVFLVCLVMFYHPRHGANIDCMIQALSHRILPAWAHRRVDYLVRSLAPFRRFPWHFHLTVLAVSWLNMTISFAAFATMALAVGIHVPWGLLVWVWSVVMLLRQLPISFHGVGVREATLVVLLGYFAVPEESAFTLGLLGFTHAVLFAIVGLIFQIRSMFNRADSHDSPAGHGVVSQIALTAGKTQTEDHTRKVLVTGAAGFIGSWLSRRLLARGDTVFGLDNLNDYYDVQLKKDRLSRLIEEPRFRFRGLDLADRNAVAGLFDHHHFDVVVHLAAQAGVRYSVTNPYAYIDSNLVAFGNILESCRHAAVKHFVYASSSSVYGANTKTPFSVEHNVDHPLSLYAATKKANELMAHAYSHLYQIPTTGLRFFTVYGPWGRPDMALYLFAKAIIEQRPINVFNYGKMRRDFTYIDDVVEGIVRIMDRPPQPNPTCSGDNLNPGNSTAPYRIYNIGSNRPVELLHVIGILENCLGRKAQKNMLPMQPGDVPETYADVDSLMQDVDFRPRTSIEDGIARFVEWYAWYHKVQDSCPGAERFNPESGSDGATAVSTENSGESKSAA